MEFDNDIFDESDLLENPKHYPIDALIETNVERTESVDAILGNIGLKPYLVSGTLVNDHAIAQYLLDAVLILDKNGPRFKESIINAILISCGKACERLAQDIANTGNRLKLAHCSGADLDDYWAKMLQLRRRYQETDITYRYRLMARLAVMKSSGTMAEIRAAIDTILGMENAATLTSYWPGELRITWNSYTAIRAAEAKLAALTEALNDMVMAGITWTTSFPYKTYDLDVLLYGPKRNEVQVDTILEKPKEKLYRLVVDFFDVGTKSYELDGYAETTHEKSQSLVAKLVAVPEKPVLVDGFLETVHDKSYDNDVTLVAHKTKNDSVDSVLTKDFRLPYMVDGLFERKRRYPYLVSVVIAE